jgi:hypothetical protein
MKSSFIYLLQKTYSISISTFFPQTSLVIKQGRIYCRFVFVSNQRFLGTAVPTYLKNNFLQMFEKQASVKLQKKKNQNSLLSHAQKNKEHFNNSSIQYSDTV